MTCYILREDVLLCKFLLIEIIDFFQTHGSSLDAMLEAILS